MLGQLYSLNSGSNLLVLDWRGRKTVQRLLSHIGDASRSVAAHTSSTGHLTKS